MTKQGEHSGKFLLCHQNAIREIARSNYVMDVKNCKEYGVDDA